MKAIAGILILVIITATALTAYAIVYKNIAIGDLIDYFGDTAKHIAGETAEVMEAAVTVACTTLVRTEVGPMISQNVLVGFTESIIQLRCGAYNGQYSATDSISIPKGFLFDWMRRDGYAELWMHVEVSVPVVMDLTDIDVQIDRRQDPVRVTYNLPSPELGQARIDFSSLCCSVDKVESMSNDEIAVASDSLFNKILCDACLSVSNEAREDGITGRIRSDLYRDLARITNSIYPDAAVEVHFIDRETQQLRGPSLREEMNIKHSGEDNDHFK